jgi:hypothetical protein
VNVLSHALRGFQYSRITVRILSVQCFSYKTGLEYQQWYFSDLGKEVETMNKKTKYLMIVTFLLITILFVGAVSAAPGGIRTLRTPRLLSPKDGTVFTGDSNGDTTLEWSAVRNAAYYQVEVYYYTGGTWYSAFGPGWILIEPTQTEVTLGSWFGDVPGAWRVTAIGDRITILDSKPSKWRTFCWNSCVIPPEYPVV